MRKKPVDAIDIQIINRLQRDANVTNKALSEEIGLSQGPTLIRVQNLWKNRVLVNYKATVDYPRFKFTHKTISVVSLDKDSVQQFLNNVQNTREIIFCAELEKSSRVVSSLKFLVALMSKGEEHMHECIVRLTRGVSVHDVETTSMTKICKDQPLELSVEDIK